MDERPLLEYLIATGPVVIFRRTPGDLVTKVSPNVERILGYSPQEVVGVPGFWAEHVHLTMAKGSSTVPARRLPEKRASSSATYPFLHKDGTYWWLHGRFHIEYDEAGPNA